MRPADLITLQEAGSLVSKSTATVRRWVRNGTVDRFTGDQPSTGGSPKVLVSKAQVLAQAGVNEVKTTPTQQVSEAPIQVSEQESNVSYLIEIASLKGRLDTLEARYDSQVELVKRLEEQLRQAREEVLQARSVSDDWKDRHDAAVAERDALRSLGGRSWWQKLLTTS